MTLQVIQVIRDQALPGNCEERYTLVIRFCSCYSFPFSVMLGCRGSWVQEDVVEGCGSMNPLLLFSPTFRLSTETAMLCRFLPFRAVLLEMSWLFVG